jgi:type II secretory pathway pseudopilin PulG
VSTRRLQHRARRGGVILLESLLALALMAAAAAATLSLAGSDQNDAARLIQRSREIQRASAFLDVVALWPREDYDRRLGTRPQGPYTLAISRPTPTIYLLELRDRDRGQLLLTTAVYREEGARDDQ